MKKLILLMSIFFCSQIFANPAEKKEEILPKVFTEILQEQDIAREVKYIGELEPVRRVKIYSPIEGMLTDIKFNLSMEVKKGQTLAIVRQNVIGLEVLPVKIKAPIDGFIYRPEVTENSLVIKNKLLFSLYSPEQFKLTLNVSPQDGEQMLLGKEVELVINNEKIGGMISAVAPNIDPTTGTRLAEIVINKDESLNLRPGMIGEAFLKFEKRKGFLLNKKYVQKKGEKNYIRLLDANNKVEELEISLGDRIKNNIEIKSDKVSSGRKIIIKSSVEPLQNEQEVQVVDKKAEEKKSNEAEVKKI